jgi:hypothetical protein
MGIGHKMKPFLKQYLEELAKRYHAHYNVETNKVIAEKQLDIYAISIIKHFRNILTKKIQFDQYHEREMILVKGFDQFVQDEDTKDFSQFLISVARELVVPSFDVMSHTINGIIVSSQGFSGEARETAQRFRYAKTFCLGIKGWCDIRLLLIDIKNNHVYCNAKGKEVASVYNFKKKTEKEAIGTNQ